MYIMVICYKYILIIFCRVICYIGNGSCLYEDFGIQSTSFRSPQTRDRSITQEKETSLFTIDIKVTLLVGRIFCFVVIIGKNFHA